MEAESNTRILSTQSPMRRSQSDRFGFFACKEKLTRHSTETVPPGGPIHEKEKPNVAEH
jgi:hypothetical protein